LVDRAVERLCDLDRATAPALVYSSGEENALPRATNPERASLFGSVYKRKAAILARTIVAGNSAAATRREFNAAVQASISAYQSAAKDLNAEIIEPYPALNWLALKSLSGRFADGIAICRRCAQIANEQFARSGNFWCAVMAPEAALVESLCDGTLSGSGAAVERRLDEIAQAYSDALATIPVAPKELDSMAQQLRLLALFFAAKGKSTIARQLRRLADRLLPGDGGEGEGNPAAAPAARRARSTRGRRARRKA
jgi:hypothetical protein